MRNEDMRSFPIGADNSRKSPAAAKRCQAAARIVNTAYNRHPEVAAKRPSKDAGRGARAVALRGSRSLSSGRPLRAGPVGSHLRVTEEGFEMEFGIFSNGFRPHTTAAQTYEEDLAEIVLADQLGFRDAYISKHHGERVYLGEGDSLPVPELWMWRAEARTQHIS